MKVKMTTPAKIKAANAAYYAALAGLFAKGATPEQLREFEKKKPRYERRFIVPSL